MHTSPHESVGCLSSNLILALTSGVLLVLRSIPRCLVWVVHCISAFPRNILGSFCCWDALMLIGTISLFCPLILNLSLQEWTLDRKIRVRFPAYPHRVWALWWQGGKRRLRTSRCPCRGRLGTLKTPSCPWRECPAAGQNLETGHLSRHYIAEISLNVTLNHNQQ